MKETHVSLFDGTNAGLAVEGRPIFSVQHHPEASPSKGDSLYLFERFADLIAASKDARGDAGGLSSRMPARVADRGVGELLHADVEDKLPNQAAPRIALAPLDLVLAAAPCWSLHVRGHERVGAIFWVSFVPFSS